jgi:ribonuclease D
MTPSNPVIATVSQLKSLITKAREVESVALDTEFVWERTYFPRLGLIQLALSDEECYLIDPLAIDDISSIGDLLIDRSVVKIFHDAPQDLAILQRVTGATPQNIFDTRLAAGFASLPETLSLSRLVKELLDIDLSKEQTRTNWLQRPLSKAQIRYALDDVRYLRAIRVLLLNSIVGPTIRSWLQEELNLLNNPASYTFTEGDERFRKIRGASSLNEASLAILKNLVNWREGIARKKDRPRGHIVKDTTLLDIAKHQPMDETLVRKATDISEKAAQKYAATLATIVTSTLKRDSDTFPAKKRPARLSKTEEKSHKRLLGLITLKCELLGIAPGLVGNSKELKQLVKILHTKKAGQIEQLRQTEGWRKKLLEDFFRQT